MSSSSSASSWDSIPSMKDSAGNYYELHGAEWVNTGPNPARDQAAAIACFSPIPVSSASSTTTFASESSASASYPTSFAKPSSASETRQDVPANVKKLYASTLYMRSVHSYLLDGALECVRGRMPPHSTQRILSSTLELTQGEEELLWKLVDWKEEDRIRPLHEVKDCVEEPEVEDH